MQKLKKDYSRFLDRKNLAPFPEFADLRRPGNYAKGIYLKKEETKKLMYVYQEKVIPRSLFKLSTEFCGSAKESDRIKGKAPGLFKNVLIFTGVLDGKKNDKQWKANVLTKLMPPCNARCLFMTYVYTRHQKGSMLQRRSLKLALMNRS